MFKGKGKLVYDPHSEASKFNFWWAKVDVHPSIIRYYQHWIQKEMNTRVNTPIWKAHITVVRGEQPKNKVAWKKYQGKLIHFDYDPVFKMSDKYFWLTVHSKELSEIRVELGLTPEPRVPFHITIANLKNIEGNKKDKTPKWVKFPWEK